MLLKIFLLFAIAFQASHARLQVGGFDRLPESVLLGHYFGKTYALFQNVKVNWMKAHLLCRGYGMKLLTIYARDEFEYITKKFLPSALDATVNTPDLHAAWTSMNDIDNLGYFTGLYSSRRHRVFFNADSDIPNNAGGRQACVEIIYQNDQYEFNDYQCEEEMPVICTVKNREYYY